MVSLPDPCTTSFSPFRATTAIRSAETSGERGRGRGEARFLLTGPTGLDFGVVEFGNQILSSSGTLLAGDYHLSVFAVMDNGGLADDGYMGGSSSFDFDFLLQESGVPTLEPGTLALVLLGIAGLGLGKRKNRR